jgi:8-oxo-dGTP pyrophosphatase MutT (NUDIX family)
MNAIPFTICVGGHQNLGNDHTRQFVEERFRTCLTTYLQRESQLLLYSAFAPGSDQLFVQIAMELGIQVEIVVPCAEYASIFSSDAEKTLYQSILQNAHAVHQLPSQHCSNDAFLAAEHWMIDRSDLAIIAWNGLPSQGKSGTGDIASYAWFVGCPFVHINTRQRTVKTYGEISGRQKTPSSSSPKRECVVAQNRVYQGKTLVVNQYRVPMPDGKEVIRDVVVRPESMLIVPAGSEDIILLIEEYDFGAGTWQLTLPGGKVEHTSVDTLEEQAQRELRQEIGYRTGRIEKLIDLYSHPGYISHQVHIFVAHELEWDPLRPEKHEEIKVHTYTLEEALAETFIDQRCDPEAALALWLYSRKKG